MQTICTSLRTDNHTNTSPLSLYRPDALADTQPTEHCPSMLPPNVQVKLKTWWGYNYGEGQSSTYTETESAKDWKRWHFGLIKILKTHSFVAKSLPICRWFITATMLSWWRLEIVFLALQPQQNQAHVI